MKKLKKSFLFTFALTLAMGCVQQPEQTKTHTAPEFKGKIAKSL